MPHDKLFFFEQTDFSLRFARCAITETSLQIEELKEVSLADAVALAALAPAGTQVVCALRPKPRQLHLASADEAKRYSGLAGLQQFAQSPAFTKGEPAWFTGAQASNGASPETTPWLLSMSSAAAQQQALAAFEAIKLKPARCLDATIATIGALTSTVTSPTLLLEIGELSSHAVLIGNKGVLSSRSVTLNLDQIADAVQNELNLKFRGSAAKLFFNPDCDFTDSGPKIAARLAAALKTDLAPLFVGQDAPTTLCCSGLPALQHWLEIQLATVLGLTPHEPNIKGWSATVGVTFGTPELNANVSPAWFNFLHFINSQTLEATDAIPWQAEWHLLSAPIAAKPVSASPVTAAAAPPTRVVTNHPFAAATPAPAPAPAAKPAAPVAATPAAAVKPPTAPAPAAAAAPAPAAKAAAPATPQKATPVAAPAKAAATPAKTTPAPATPTKPSPAPVVVQSKAAVSQVQHSPKSTPPTAPTSGGKKPEAKSKMPLFIGIGVLALALGGGFFYLQGQNEENARVAAEKEKAELNAKANAQRVAAEKEKSRLEVEARKKLDSETSQKLALAEAARLNAEAETRNQAASRLANARGTLFVTTNPSGATVTVADLPSKQSPATFSYMRIGKYPVTITLARHEEVKLELEVTENNTTESGIIPLVSVIGSASITSEPSGSSYELRPANGFSVGSEDRRTGQTPATLDDLDLGDYKVTFSRPGWAPHTETITIARNATARASWNFPSGYVKISSSPTGAIVTQDGVKVGVTPVTLRQPPGVARFELKTAFHDSVTLPAQIEENKTVELTALLPLTDMIFGASEVDKNAEPISPKPPVLPSRLTLVDGKVVVQMTIDRDGNPTDLKLVRASNPEIGKIYMAALAKWKFKPGIKDGKPVRSTVVVPFLISASKD